MARTRTRNPAADGFLLGLLRLSPGTAKGTAERVRSGVPGHDGH